MTHILLTPNGTFGDIQPFLGLADKLRERGHRVTFICNPYFRELIEQLDHELIPLGTEAELMEYWEHPDMWHSRRYWRLGLEYCAVRPMRELYDLVVERYIPGETVVAGPGWSFGARIAQEHLHIPLATVHLEPFWIRSLHRSPLMPPPMLTQTWVPRVSRRAQFWIADTFFIDRYLAGPVNGFRAELGLPPVNQFLKQWWHSPQRVIGLFPRWFQSPQPDWPSQLRQVDFPLWDRSEVTGLSDEVEAFLHDGTPPVAFTFSTGNRQAGDFYSIGIEACRRLGLRAMILTCHREQLPKSLPAHARHFDYVPLCHLKGRLAAVVHHAGTGTAAQCMRAAIPQVVSPMAYDSPDFARCLQQLGVARVLKPRNVSVGSLVKCLEDALAPSEIASRCAQVAQQFEGVDPFERFADQVEDLIDSPPLDSRNEKNVTCHVH